jgi:nucleotide-binding universal stress UspA family protein
MYKKILVPLDGSTLSEAVLPHVKALAKLENAEVVILRVSAIPASEFIARDPIVAANVIQEMEEETQGYIDKEVKLLKEDGIKKVSGIMREGPVPDAILDVAEETHADMIAMSTHGRTGMQRFLMGSVADKVVHYAHIPVILVHPN